MNQKILNILSIILTLVLWGLQMLPCETQNGFLLWVKAHLYAIAAVAAGIVVLLHVADLFARRERNAKEWLCKFLKHILDEHLAGEYYQVRISLLKAEPGYKIFFKSFFYHIVRCFWSNTRRHAWRHAWNDVAVHVMSEYLTVYVRYGYPKGKPSHAYFRMSEDPHCQHFNGIAHKCYVEGEPIKVHSVDISNVDVTRPLAELESDERRKVEKYMKDCFFDTSYYGTLRLMHRISNNLYAIPVTLSDQSIWGVVIIDNVGKRRKSEEEELDSFMPSYMRIISLSLSSLKRH